MAKKKVHHEMVAYSGELTDVLRDVLRDNLSPEGVAAIAAYLRGAKLKNAGVQREVDWFRGLLVEMVEPEFEDYCKDLGLQTPGKE